MWQRDSPVTRQQPGHCRLEKAIRVSDSGPEARQNRSAAEIAAGKLAGGVCPELYTQLEGDRGWALARGWKPREASEGRPGGRPCRGSGIIMTLTGGSRHRLISV